MLMTPEKIKTALGFDGVEVRKGDNDEYFWATLRAHGQTKSARVSTTATESDLERLRYEFESWKDEEGG